GGVPSTPSSSHARGTAGPEKGTMAFLDDAEVTTYRMLKQVLQNHCTTQMLCLPHTLVACGALVALVGAQWDETREYLERVGSRTGWRPLNSIPGRGGALRPSRRSRRRVWPPRARPTSPRARPYSRRWRSSSMTASPPSG